MTVQLDSGSQYSYISGFAFLFNLIVGTGSLALPATFQQAGWLTGCIVLIVLSFLSFIPMTYLIETMSLLNAVRKHRSRTHSPLRNSINNLDEDDSNSEVDNAVGCGDEELFEITEKFEIGKMFEELYGNMGNIIFYIVIAVYLFGDLAIYAACVPKSLRDVTCSNNLSAVVMDTDVCWTSSSLTRLDVYRIYVVVFGSIMCPFLFFNVSRSRWLQLFTTTTRWIAMLLMLALSIVRIVFLHNSNTLANLFNPSSWHQPLGDNFTWLLAASGDSAVPNLPVVRFAGIPTLFGVSIYAFMCHHSLPGVFTPIRNKHRIVLRLVFPVVLVILLFYISLSVTAMAAFEKVEDLYTLNYIPTEEFIRISRMPYVLCQIIGYFLSLFPVYALSSTFPIVGTTLLGNLFNLTSFVPILRSDRIRYIFRYSLPFVVVIPPVLLALMTSNITFVAGLTGGVVGALVQYVIPSVLVYQARIHASQVFASNLSKSSMQSESILPLSDQAETSLLNSFDEDIRRGYFSNFCQRMKIFCHIRIHPSVCSQHTSPFQHVAWIIFLNVWAVVCVVAVLVDKIYTLAT